MNVTAEELDHSVELDRSMINQSMVNRKQSDISLQFDVSEQDANQSPFFIPSSRPKKSLSNTLQVGSPKPGSPRPGSPLQTMGGGHAEAIYSSSLLKPGSEASSSLLQMAKGSREVSSSQTKLTLMGDAEEDIPTETIPQKSPKETMVDAIKLLCMSLAITREFRTLRDHGGLAEMAIKDFHVVKRLGEGSFATVEKCLYVPQNRVVAVKKIKVGMKLSHLDIRDMKKEIALLRKLRHPAIIEFIGYGSFDLSSTKKAEESLFLVEEFVNGGTLKGLIQRQMFETRPLYRMQDAVRWMIEMAQGLKYLHQCQPMVIHRDLKLENILLQGTDPRTLSTKIADFGLSALVTNDNIEAEEEDFSHLHAELAQQLSVEASKPSEIMAKTWTENAKRRVSILHLPQNLTPERRQSILMQPTPQARRASILMVPPMNRRTSLLSKLDKEEKLLEVCCADMLSGRTGTLMYMAPEVYRQEPYNEKADVFSYAIIAYELLHSYMMISATDGSYAEVQAYARRVARAHYRPPLDAGLPKELMTLIKKCWEPKPELRPSMAEVIKMLLEINASLDWVYWERVWAAQWQEDGANEVQVIEPESMLVATFTSTMPNIPSLNKPKSGVVAPAAGGASASASPALAAKEASVAPSAKVQVTDAVVGNVNEKREATKEESKGCGCVVS